MKKEDYFEIKIDISYGFAYFLMFLLVLTIFSLGVYALTPGTAPNPGHLISEVSPISSCSANQFLKFDGTNWVCSAITESDPTVTASVKDGISWNEISGIPQGFADGIDNAGYPDAQVQRSLGGGAFVYANQ